MKHNPFHYGPRIDLCVRKLIWAVIAMLIVVVNCENHTSDGRPDEDVYLHPMNNAKIYFLVDAQDTVQSIIQPGDSVKLLGVRKSFQLWVQTADGQRGIMNQEDFDNRVVPFVRFYVDEDLTDYSDDTLLIKGLVNKRWFVECTKDTTTLKVSEKTVAIPVANDHTRWYMNDYPSHIITLKRFEEQVIGSTIAACDSIGYPALTIVHIGDSIKAYTSLKVYNPDDAKFYSPILNFNSQGICTSYFMSKAVHDTPWLLKYIPGVTWFLDQTIVSEIVSSGVYLYSLPLGITGKWPVRITWGIGVAIGAIGALLWLILPGFIPAYLMLFLVRCRKPFSKLGNDALERILIITSIVGVMLWSLLMLIWGAWTWFIIIADIFMIRRFRNQYRSLFSLYNSPENRCWKCRTLYAAEEVSRKLTSESIEWRRENNTSWVSSRTENWKEVVTTITRWSNGREEKSGSSTDHGRDFSTHRTDYYNVKYLVKHYMITYRCKECGRESYGSYEDYTCLESNYTNSSYHEQLDRQY